MKFSACASSAIRLSYTIKLARSKDITYYNSIMGVWTLPEIASGILAMCLPVSPKFFRSLKDSPLWSSPKRIFQPFRLKPDALGTSDLHPDVNKVAKCKTDSGGLRTIFRKYNILQGETELVSKSKNSSSEPGSRNESSMEISRKSSNHTQHYWNRDDERV